ncbi:PAS domain-containing protein [Arenibacter sp. BSSL-BM3]|uniref:protein-glutamate O-methyltransferase n=1 Tax=Arenibacter arenosicollis TaxID=2762274 RepID=A0ABR7QJI3_9FLAO|nr:chemotaxis protein CheB [Arenibacter arenosicollis]MBC8767333.1 PAS domain-containing protein [Arenibacter arenosicollis]
MTKQEATNITTANKKKAPLKKKGPKKDKENNFLIVGMGASAGGLEAFKEFFDTMPPTSGMAFVLVQHLDPTHKSLMVQLLKNHTKMEVTQVRDNTKVLPNHVYIIPPNKDMAIFQGVLHLMEPMAPRGFRKPIDFFLRSLAEDRTDRAIGIILSGTGREGTLSLKDIKGKGGLSIVQDPETAKYDGMPRSAIEAGVEDFVLPVKKMPEVLLKYAKNRKFEPKGIPLQVQTPHQLLEKVFILLRNETGCNFADYKSSTVVRRIEKRMALNQIEKLEDYIKYLQTNPEEVQKLFKELLIGVTSFFRDKEIFDSLKEKVVKKIIADKNDGDTIRLWVPGCSTGEEAYSLAILFDEVIKNQPKALKVQIFASDLDENAIYTARQGIYPETIAVDIDPNRLSHYFHGDKHTYRIKKGIRDQIVFAEHNIIKDPPFSKLDMISCRNLLIYLNLEAQKKVFAIFHYALNPEGILLLGNSESLGEYARFFDVLDRKHKIFKFKDAQRAEMPDIGHLFQEPIPIKTVNIPAHKREWQSSLANITSKVLLANYAPACAIINFKGDALYFSGNTGKYLQPSPGEARLNIIDMAREGLKSDLSALISTSRRIKKMEVKKNVLVKTNGTLQAINLTIRPLSQLDANIEYWMVTFEDVDTPTVKPKVTLEKKPEDITEIQALEQELTATKEYLRSTIEQLEISNEELKSSNEELQSSNEELQSTNEEMETSKEELQSVNEEIVTVNTELQGKIDELARAYDDMNNLLASTEIGTIFLDSDLKIKRFTPAMSKIINLINSDVGRPIDHLSSNLIYNGIMKDAQTVLNKLTPYKTAVKSSDGLWYQMQIMPYRTSENVIAGVVITFVDITQEKKLGEQLLDFKKEYEHILEMTKTVVYTQNDQLIYTSMANIHPDFQFRNMIEKKDGDFFSEEDAKKLENIKRKVLNTGKPERATLELKISGEARFYDLMVRPISEEQRVTGVACSSIDITDLVAAEKELEILKAKKNGR